ncbi:MAG TPA: hypothetical protein VL126_03360 [Bacteroidota bacterium]|nr:hypothetical protein [Bacteroidota bacterium]
MNSVRSEIGKLENYVLGSSAAIITNIGLIVGLGSARAGKGAILSGLLTIALADNISDSLGIRLYKESEGYGERMSRLATLLNFLSRLVVSFTFIVIVYLFPLRQATIGAIGWALLLLTIVSYLITKEHGQNSLLGIIKRVMVAVIVIALSLFAGSMTAGFVG